MIRRSLRTLADTRVWGVLTKVFGNKDNAAISKHLREHSAAALACAEKFRAGIRMDLAGIVEDEHRGDQALKALSLAIEQAFITRSTLGKSDVTYLGHELDNVIDGMRDTAEHIDTFRRFLPSLPAPAGELIEIVYEDVQRLNQLVRELTNGRIDFPVMNELSARISEIERQADGVRLDAIRGLVDSDFDDYREFSAQKDLIDLLESITDHVKHCSVTVLSMARQEA